MESAAIDSQREGKYGCPRKSYISRMGPNGLNESETSGLDILANIASPKHHRVDSFSNMSLPDDMRISFSESEFQIDDDFSYSPSTDVDLSSVNIISVDSNSDLTEDKDLQSIQASISSTSGYKSGSSTRNSLESLSDNLSYNKSNMKGKEKTTLHNLESSNYQFSNGDASRDGELQLVEDEKPWTGNIQAQQVSTVGSSGEVLDKKLISPRRRNKGKHVTNIACQVCGDVAAGFYCGAYICEACKKFYMRAYKLEKMKYVCLRDKNCIITKESRVQCQYCRYQKCLKLNMYYLNKGEGENNKEALMSEIPCRVCSAPSSGFHFGAITCEGCKGFFRRMAKEREPEKYQCTKKGNCEINMLTRNLCKACRYKQCLNAGMSVEGSRIGRQPNSVKHLISMEVKKQVKSEPDVENSLSCEIENSGNTDIVNGGNTDIVNGGLNIHIKAEPIDFSDLPLDTPCDRINWGNSDKKESEKTLQNLGDVILLEEPTRHSASAHKPAQKTYNNSAVNTSNTEPSHPLFMAELNQQSSPLFRKLYSESLSTNIPKINDLDPSKTLKSHDTVNGNDRSSHNYTPMSPQTSATNSAPSYVLGQKSSNWAPQQQDSEPSKKVKQSVSKSRTTHSQQSSPTFTQQSGNQTSPWQTNGPVKDKQFGSYCNSHTDDKNMTMMEDLQNTCLLTNGCDIMQHGRDRQHSPEDVKPEYSTNKRFLSQVYAEEQLNSSKPKKSKQPMDTQHAEQIKPSLPYARPQFSFGPGGGGDDDDLRRVTVAIDIEMPEFIHNVIEAGKCLQLLNYRVFDTDLNPTASMNVDEIKNVFKLKNVDPKAGNTITSSVNMSMFASKESTWSYMMTNFHNNTYITIRFAKMVPGFKNLSLNDQVRLIQTSIYPIELLNMSKVYDPVTKRYNYFTYTKEEENIMMEHFPMLRVFQEHFLHVGEMVTTFNLTDEEVALLSALLLFPAEISGLEDPKAVEDLQNKVTEALQYYEERRFVKDGLTRFGILLVRVAELIQCLLQHNLAIGLLLTHNPTIKVPQLFHELIIESIKEGQIQ